ncbi:MAG TPA: tRNA (adenosine(37)-N6)-threonylcarbamoyltransferase complex ATPase subunit type 1 TsaE [Candidatus Dormibacteraeota bacterium]|nr:tRNA (adenosine(37)-N6)-threonylcarbamoyltransferase complex ATPase subunit type 1 TsaE [Candidatus Dormibacteraeota bacterium]
MDRVEIVTASEEETRAVGRRLAGVLRGGERIGLSGELGAGKTCFVRGLAEGLGIPPEDVRSPSFPILIPYESGRLPLYHIDLFRLPAGDIDSLSLREYIYGPGICAIEWPEHLDEPMGDHLAIHIDFAPGGGRRLVAVACGSGYVAAIEALDEIQSEKALKKRHR